MRFGFGMENIRPPGGLSTKISNYYEMRKDNTYKYVKRIQDLWHGDSESSEECSCGEMHGTVRVLDLLRLLGM